MSRVALDRMLKGSGDRPVWWERGAEYESRCCLVFWAPNSGWCGRKRKALVIANDVTSRAVTRIIASGLNCALCGSCQLCLRSTGLLGQVHVLFSFLHLTCILRPPRPFSIHSSLRPVFSPNRSQPLPLQTPAPAHYLIFR